jgi:hypothetical protein
MKFNYLATILMGTVALASNFNAGPANATDCEPLYVPWTWKLDKIGDFDSSVKAERLGTHPSNSNDPDTDSLSGTFVVSLLFEEPTDYCEKLGNAPTENSLQVLGYFSGFLSTNYLQIPIEVPGFPLTKWALANASLKIKPENAERITLFDHTDEVTLLQMGEKEIMLDREEVITVKNGDRISFSGNLDADATKGLDPFSEGFSLASAQLYVRGGLIEPKSGWVKYTIPTQGTPEPLTMLASATAVGFGAFFKRQHSKNQKKS